MDATLRKIAFGGGCHWCTEAIFQQIEGVQRVEQGFVASTGENSKYSEGVILHFNNNEISLSRLIEIHLHTHQSTSDHSMRKKYRSAIYYFDISTKDKALKIVANLQADFSERIITEILPFISFKVSRKEIRNYYLNGPDKPFCKKFIDPKLDILKTKFEDDLL